MWKKGTLNDPLNMTSFAWLGSPHFRKPPYTHTDWKFTRWYTHLNLKKMCCFETFYCNKHGWHCCYTPTQRFWTGEPPETVDLRIFGSFQQPLPSGTVWRATSKSTGCLLRRWHPPIGSIGSSWFSGPNIYAVYISTWIIMDYFTWLMC